MVPEKTPIVSPFLPELRRYNDLVSDIFNSGWITNGGPLVQELEQRLALYLKVKNLVCVSSGTVALQLIYKALGLQGQAITTPFSFVATSSSLKWQGIEPVFCDIDNATFNLNPDILTFDQMNKAIVATHVYGNPAGTQGLEKFAEKNAVPLIFDAAHAFGVDYHGSSILSRGTASALSFHATKLFHCIEGGAVATNDDALADEVRALRNFGIKEGQLSKLIGINAKMSEFHAGMGLCVLDEISFILEKRQELWSLYREKLEGYVSFQKWSTSSQNNNSYAPVVFGSEELLFSVKLALEKRNIETKRYFWPSLDSWYPSESSELRVSEDIASRVLCLPLFPGLETKKVISITEQIKQSVEQHNG